MKEHAKVLREAADKVAQEELQGDSTLSSDTRQDPDDDGNRQTRLAEEAVLAEIEATLHCTESCIISETIKDKLRQVLKLSEDVTLSDKQYAVILACYRRLLGLDDEPLKLLILGGPGNLE